MKVAAKQLQSQLGELRPTSSTAKHDAEILHRLAAKGVLMLGESRHENVAPYPVIRRSKRASQMVIDDRT